MKIIKILLGTIFIGSSINIFAQQNIAVNQLPSTVKDGFEVLYPNQLNVTWQEQMGYYFAIFNVNGAKTKVLLDLKGARIETFKNIQASALPAAVASYLSANYSGQTVTDTEQLTMLNNAIRYEVYVGGKDLLFYENGNFIRVLGGGPIKQ